MSFSTGYASSISSASDLAGNSWAAWAENGLLYAARWDSAAQRWGDAAVISNATGGRRVTLTAARVVRDTATNQSLPALVVTWEQGPDNASNVYGAVGFYRNDGSVVWSDAMELLPEGVAQSHHSIGVSQDDRLILASEAQALQDPISSGPKEERPSTYQDSDINTFALRIQARSSTVAAQDPLYSQRLSGGSFLGNLPGLLAAPELVEGRRLIGAAVNGVPLELGQDTTIAGLGVFALSDQGHLRFERGSNNPSELQFSGELIGTDARGARGYRRTNALLQPVEQNAISPSSPPPDYGDGAYALSVSTLNGAGEVIATSTQPIRFTASERSERVSANLFQPVRPPASGNPYRSFTGSGAFSDDNLNRAAAAANASTNLAGTALFDVATLGSGFTINPYQLNHGLPTRWGIRFTDFASAFMGNGGGIPLTWFKTMGWEFGLDGLFSYRTHTADGDLKQTLDLDSSLNLTIGQLNRLGGKGDRNPLRLLKANNANELKPFDSRGPFSKAGQNFRDSSRDPNRITRQKGDPSKNEGIDSSRTRSRNPFSLLSGDLPTQGSRPKSVKTYTSTDAKAAKSNLGPDKNNLSRAHSSSLSESNHSSFGNKQSLALTDGSSSNSSSQSQSIFLARSFKYRNYLENLAANSLGGAHDSFSLLNISAQAGFLFGVFPLRRLALSFAGRETYGYSTQRSLGISAPTLERKRLQVGLYGELGAALNVNVGFGNFAGSPSFSLVDLQAEAGLRFGLYFGMARSQPTRDLTPSLIWPESAGYRQALLPFLVNSSEGVQNFFKGAYYVSVGLASLRGLNGARALLQNRNLEGKDENTAQKLKWSRFDTLLKANVGLSAGEGLAQLIADVPYLVTAGSAIFGNLAPSSWGALGEPGIGIDLYAYLRGSTSILNGAIGSYLKIGTGATLGYPDVSARFNTEVGYILGGISHSLVNVTWNTTTAAEGRFIDAFQLQGAAVEARLHRLSGSGATANPAEPVSPAPFLLAVSGGQVQSSSLFTAAGRSALNGAAAALSLYAVLTVPEQGALDGEGFLRDFRLSLQSDARLRLSLDQRALQTGAARLQLAQPWLTLLDQWDQAPPPAGSAPQEVTTAAIARLRPGQEIPVRLDLLLPAGAEPPRLSLGWRQGGQARVPFADGAVTNRMAGAPQRRQDGGSELLLGEGASGALGSPVLASLPYIAALVVGEGGTGYDDTDFLIEDAGAIVRGRLLASPAAAGQVTGVDLYETTPSAAFAGEAYGRLEGSGRLRARTSAGSDAVLSLSGTDGRLSAVDIAKGAEGSGYLNGGSGRFSQTIRLGAASALLRLEVESGGVVRATILNQQGAFPASASATLANAVGGEGQGLVLHAITRTSVDSNRLDDGGLAIGSFQRYVNEGFSSEVDLTYTQGGPDATQPINSGLNLDQPIIANRFLTGRGWVRLAMADPDGAYTPGVDGYNFDSSTNSLYFNRDTQGGKRTLLLFSHADLRAIRDEHDLYLLEDALQQAQVYASLETKNADNSLAFAAPQQLSDPSAGGTNTNGVIRPFYAVQGAGVAPVFDANDQVLAAWVHTSPEGRAEIQVRIGRALGTVASGRIEWSPIRAIPLPDGVAGDAVTELTLTTLDGRDPVLSWSLNSLRPYQAGVLAGTPKTYYRLNDLLNEGRVASIASDTSLGDGRVVEPAELWRNGSWLGPLSTAPVQSSDGALLPETPTLERPGDPDLAMAFAEGGFLELPNVFADRLLNPWLPAPSGYSADFWLKSDPTDPLASLLDNGLYNPAAVLPSAEALRLPVQLQRLASTELVDGVERRGYRYSLLVPASSYAAIEGQGLGSGLSPFNLSFAIAPAELVFRSAARPDLPLRRLALEGTLLDGLASPLLTEDRLTSFTLGDQAVVLDSRFEVDDSSPGTSKTPELLTYDAASVGISSQQIPGWSVRKRLDADGNERVEYRFGPDQGSQSLSLSGTLRRDAWNHIAISYGEDPTLATKVARLFINGELAGEVLEDPANLKAWGFNTLPLQVGYHLRGRLDELVIHDQPIVDAKALLGARLLSRTVDPRSATQATFSSRGSFDPASGAWSWAAADPYRIASAIPPTTPGFWRSGPVDLVGAGNRQELRADGQADLRLRLRLSGLTQGTVLTGLRVRTSDGQEFGLGDGLTRGMDGRSGAAVVTALLGAVASGSLLNSGPQGRDLRFGLMSQDTDLEILLPLEASCKGQKVSVTAVLQTPENRRLGVGQVTVRTFADQVLEASGGKGLLSIYQSKIQVEGEVWRSAPRSLAEINTGFSAPLARAEEPQLTAAAAEDSPDPSYADAIALGRLRPQGSDSQAPFLAIGNASLAGLGGSGDRRGLVWVLRDDLGAGNGPSLRKTTSAKLQQLQSLVGAGPADRFLAAQLDGLVVMGADGQQIGSALLWADLDGDGNDELVLGVPGQTGADGSAGSGAVVILSGAYLRDQTAVGSRVIDLATLSDPTTVRVLQGPQGSAFGTALAFGPVGAGGAPALLIGAPDSRARQTTDRLGNPIAPADQREAPVGAVFLLPRATNLFAADAAAPVARLLLSGDLPGLPNTNSGAALSSRRFGASLTLSSSGRDFSGDGIADLAIGLPGLTMARRLRGGIDAAATVEQRDGELQLRQSLPPEYREDGDPTELGEPEEVQMGGVLLVAGGFGLEGSGPLADQARKVLLLGNAVFGDAAEAGEALASGGDFDGEASGGAKVDDLAIGLPGMDSQVGMVSLVDGAAIRRWFQSATADSYRLAAQRRSALLDAALLIPGDQPGGRYGRVLSLAGDVNLDGRQELVVGDDAYVEQTGRVQVFFGQKRFGANASSQIQAGTTVAYHNLQRDEPAFRLDILPAAFGQGLGRSLLVADVNSDATAGHGSADLLLPTSRLGSDLHTLWGRDKLTNLGVLTLQNLAGTDGIELPAPYRQPAIQPGLVGDVNGDGMADALIDLDPANLRFTLAYGLGAAVGPEHQDAGTGGTATIDLGNHLRLQHADLSGLLALPSRDRLRDGESLNPGEFLLSPSGRYRAVMQTDGNFVVEAVNADGTLAETSFALSKLYRRESIFAPRKVMPIAGSNLEFSDIPGTRLDFVGGKLEFVNPRFRDAGNRTSPVVLEPMGATYSYRHPDASGVVKDWTVSPEPLLGRQPRDLRLLDDGTLQATATDGSLLFSFARSYRHDYAAAGPNPYFRSALQLNGVQAAGDLNRDGIADLLLSYSLEPSASRRAEGSSAIPYQSVLLGGDLLTSNTLAQAAVPQPILSQPDRLVDGESLEPGERLRSRNGRFEAVMQADGNFVVVALRDDGSQAEVSYSLDAVFDAAGNKVRPDSSRPELEFYQLGGTRLRFVAGQLLLENPAFRSAQGSGSLLLAAGSYRRAGQSYAVQSASLGERQAQELRLLDDGTLRAIATDGTVLFAFSPSYSAAVRLQEWPSSFVANRDGIAAVLLARTASGSPDPAGAALVRTRSGGLAWLRSRNALLAVDVASAYREWWAQLPAPAPEDQEAIAAVNAAFVGDLERSAANNPEAALISEDNLLSLAARLDGLVSGVGVSFRDFVAARFPHYQLQPLRLERPDGSELTASEFTITVVDRDGDGVQELVLVPRSGDGQAYHASLPPASAQAATLRLTAWSLQSGGSFLWESTGEHPANQSGAPGRAEVRSVQAVKAAGAALEQVDASQLDQKGDFLYGLNGASLSRPMLHLSGMHDKENSGNYERRFGDQSLLDRLSKAGEAWELKIPAYVWQMKTIQESTWKPDQFSTAAPLNEGADSMVLRLGAEPAALNGAFSSLSDGFEIRLDEYNQSLAFRWNGDTLWDSKTADASLTLQSLPSSSSAEDDSFAKDNVRSFLRPLPSALPNRAGIDEARELMSALGTWRGNLATTAIYVRYQPGSFENSGKSYAGQLLINLASGARYQPFDFAAGGWGIHRVKPNVMNRGLQLAIPVEKPIALSGTELSLSASARSGASPGVHALAGLEFNTDRPLEGTQLADLVAVGDLNGDGYGEMVGIGHLASGWNYDYNLDLPHSNLKEWGNNSEYNATYSSYEGFHTYQGTYIHLPTTSSSRAKEENRFDILQSAFGKGVERSLLTAPVIVWGGPSTPTLNDLTPIVRGHDGRYEATSGALKDFAQFNAPQVSPLGDMNGDGFDDIAILDQSVGGSAYILYGGSGLQTASSYLERFGAFFAETRAKETKELLERNNSADNNALNYSRSQSSGLGIGDDGRHAASFRGINLERLASQSLADASLPGFGGVRVTRISGNPGELSRDLGGGEDFNGDGLPDLFLSSAPQEREGRSSAQLAPSRYVIFGSDATGSVTLAGTPDSDSLRGTPANDVIVGLAGNDILRGLGGLDAIDAGPGDDRIELPDDRVRRIDGGSGDDTLSLGGARDQAWDFTRLASAGRLRNLETISLEDYGANTLTLNAAAVAALTDGRGSLSIDGDPATASPAGTVVQSLNARIATLPTGSADRSLLGDLAVRYAQATFSMADISVLRPVAQDLLLDRLYDELRQANGEAPDRPLRDLLDRLNAIDPGESIGLAGDFLYDNAQGQALTAAGLLSAYDRWLSDLPAKAVVAWEQLSPAQREQLAALPQAWRSRYAAYFAGGGSLPPALALEQSLASGGVSTALEAYRRWAGRDPSASWQRENALLEQLLPELRAEVFSRFDSLRLSSAFVMVGEERPAGSGSYSLYSANGGQQRLLVPGWVAVDIDPAVPLTLSPTSPLAPVETASQLQSAGSGNAPAPADETIVTLAPPAPSRADLRIAVSEAVADDDDAHLRFTLTRSGFLDETTRVAFQTAGIVDDRLPAAQGQVVFLPGVTTQEILLPLTLQGDGDRARRDPDTEAFLESVDLSLTLLPADQPGPRRTSSVAIQALDAYTPELADVSRPLPAFLRDPASLFQRHLALQLPTALWFEAQANDDNTPIHFSVDNPQGQPINEVLLRDRLSGAYVSLFEAIGSGPQADATLLPDTDARASTALHFSVADGGRFDQDGRADGAITLAAAPALTAPGPVLLGPHVLRAPTSTGTPLLLTTPGRGFLDELAPFRSLLLIPMESSDGGLTGADERRLLPDGEDYLTGLAERLSTASPQRDGLLTLDLPTASGPRPLAFARDTAYLVAVSRRDPAAQDPSTPWQARDLGLPQLQPSASAAERGRSHLALDLVLGGQRLALAVSTPLFVVPGLMGEAIPLSSLYIPPSASAGGRLAWLRLDDTTSDPTSLLAASDLAERLLLVAPDGGMQARGGDGLLPLLFSGIDPLRWLALPQEQRRLAAADGSWRVDLADPRLGAAARIERLSDDRYRIGADGVLQLRYGLPQQPAGPGPASLIFAGEGVDVLQPADGAMVFAGTDADTIRLESPSSRVEGGQGNDRFLLMAGSHRLLGGDGDDTFVLGDRAEGASPGLGSAWLSGGPGADTYWLTDSAGAPPASPLRISDFAPTADRLGLRGLRFSDLNLQQNGRQVWVSAGNSVLAILESATLAAIADPALFLTADAETALTLAPSTVAIPSSSNSGDGRLLPSELTSDGVAGLAAFSRRVFGATAASLAVYLHQGEGEVTIGGGKAGRQTINSARLAPEEQDWIREQLRQVADTLGLALRFVSASAESNLDVYLDGDLGAQTLGISLANDNGRQAWWELLLNSSLLRADPARFRFAVLHELGHVLGLEHPHDGADGDQEGEAFGQPDVETTLMAYTAAPGGWPQSYRTLDWAALARIWGLNPKASGWRFVDAAGKEEILSTPDALQRLERAMAGDLLLGAVALAVAPSEPPPSPAEPTPPGSKLAGPLVPMPPESPPLPLVQEEILDGPAVSGSGAPPTPLAWEPAWRELDLALGVAITHDGAVQDLDPHAAGLSPSAGLRLPGLMVQGSPQGEVVHAAATNVIDLGAGADLLVSQAFPGGNNQLFGGPGDDRFVLGAPGDRVAGGLSVAGTAEARADGEANTFWIDLDRHRSGDAAIQILDVQLGRDSLALIDPEGGQAEPVAITPATYLTVRDALSRSHAILLNAAPEARLSRSGLALTAAQWRSAATSQQALLDPNAFFHDPDQEPGAATPPLAWVDYDGSIPWLRLQDGQLRIMGDPAAVPAAGVYRFQAAVSDGLARSPQRTISLAIDPTVQIGERSVASGSSLGLRFQTPLPSAVELLMQPFEANGLPSGPLQPLSGQVGRLVPAGFNGLEATALAGDGLSGGSLTFFLRRADRGLDLLPLQVEPSEPGTLRLRGDDGFVVALELFDEPPPAPLTTSFHLGTQTLVGLQLPSVDPFTGVGLRLELSIDLYREAGFNNTVGFYLADRRSGAVLDAATGLPVGDGPFDARGQRRADYANQALQHSIWSGAVANAQQATIRSDFRLPPRLNVDNIVALPYLEVQDPDHGHQIYFSPLASNVDDSRHISLLGANTFGFEDLFGGGDNDFNDVIAHVRSLQVIT